MASWQQIPDRAQARQGTDVPWGGGQQGSSPLGHPGYNMAYAPVINVQCVSRDIPKAEKKENSKPKPSPVRRSKPSRAQHPPQKRQVRKAQSSNNKVGQEVTRRQHKNNLRARNHHHTQSTTPPPRACDKCGGLHWNRQCPQHVAAVRPLGRGTPVRQSVSPISFAESTSSVRASRDSTFVPESTVLSGRTSRVHRPDITTGSGNHEGLDAVLSSFRGLCCAAGNPTMADLQSTWVKLQRRRLEGSIEGSLRERWNYLVRVAARERRMEEDGQLWTMLLV